MTGKPKWTPGPWKVEGRLVGGADRVRVADCHVAERGTYENAANSRLVAAAPEMAEALREIVTARDCEGVSIDLSLAIDKGRAALRKAGGGE